MRKFLSSILLPLTLCCALFFTEGRSAVVQTGAPKERASSRPLTIEADSISYDERSSRAVAEGHAALYYMDLTLSADRVEVATDSSVAKAYATEGKQIVITRSGVQTLKGRYLEYDLQGASGKLEAPEGQSPAPRGTLYAKGEHLALADAQSAHEKKWLHGKYLKDSAPDDMVVRWDDVSYTTCRQEKPHYRLKSKKAVMVPNQYMILYRPRIYAGGTYLMTSPFNMVVHSRKRKSGVITFRPDFDDDKRYGLTASSRLAWKNGMADLKASYWSRGIFEYNARLDQKIADGLSLYAVTERSYDGDLKDTCERPRWGAVLSHEGWKMDVGWSEREKRSVVRKPGQEPYETTLWRKNDINVTSPWLGIHTGMLSQYVRVKGNYGSYQETGTNLKAHGDFIDRYGWGAEYYTELPFRWGAWTLSPFFKGDYWNYGYENDGHNRQIISSMTCGITASRGAFEIGSAFTQQRVSGHSAFRRGWDAKSDTDTFYQRVGFKIGRDLTLSVQGIWDMTGRKNELTSVGYILSYDNSCCTRWTLTCNDDVTDKNKNDWFTLSFTITAFPDSKFDLGSHALANPFGRPGGLPERKRRKSETMMERQGTQQAEAGEIQFPGFDI